MKVKNISAIEKGEIGEIMEAFEIYMINGNYLFSCAPKHYEALFAFREDEVEIIDNSLDNFCYIRSERGFSVTHVALKGIYEDVIEQFPEAIEEFKKRLDYNPWE